MRIAFVTASLVVLGGSLGVAVLIASSAPSFAAARSYPPEEALIRSRSAT